MLLNSNLSSDTSLFLSYIARYDVICDVKCNENRMMLMQWLVQLDDSGLYAEEEEWMSERLQMLTAY